MERERGGGSRFVWLWLLAVVLGLEAWACVVAVEPATPAATAECGSVWTRVLEMERTLAPIETLVAELVPTCGALWDECCVPGTLTRAAPTSTHTAVATPQEGVVMLR